MTSILDNLPLPALDEGAAPSFDSGTSILDSLPLPGEAQGPSIKPKVRISVLSTLLAVAWLTGQPALLALWVLVSNTWGRGLTLHRWLSTAKGLRGLGEEESGIRTS